jgi:hypothetical protein
VIAKGLRCPPAVHRPARVGQEQISLILRSADFACLATFFFMLGCGRNTGLAPPKLLIVRSERVPCRNSGVPFYRNLMMVPAFSCGW